MRDFIFEERAYKNFRCLDVSGLIGSMMIKQYTTLDLIKYVCGLLKESYPDQKIVLLYDGIANVSIYCSDILLFSGSFYEVEAFYHVSSKAFQMFLFEKMNEHIETECK